jgi:hypothetical protein
MGIDAAGPIGDMLTNPLPQNLTRGNRACRKNHPIVANNFLDLDATKPTDLHICVDLAHVEYQCLRMPDILTKTLTKALGTLMLAIAGT